MWKFLKSIGAYLYTADKPKPEYKKFIVEGNEAYNLMRLFDEAGHDAYAASGKYRLWKKIIELYPETENGYWRCYASTMKFIITNEPRED